MLVKLRFILILLFFGSVALAQDPIATERPTQSIGSLVLPHNSFQFEQGFTYAQDSLTLDGFFRLGVSDLGEIRIFTYYDSPLVTVGAKVNILKNKGYRPGIALKVDLTGAQVSDYRVAIMQKLSDNFGATINFGKASQFYGIFAIGYSFADRFGAYLEAYYEKSYSQYNAGLTYMVNSETQVDLNTGLLNGDAMYVTAGFARRFLFKKGE